MAPTKKNLKETHLADQESTGIDVPAEVQGNIELAPAEVAKPKRGRPSTKAAKTDGNDEKKPKKIKKIPEQEAVATGEEKIITDNAPVEPATTEIKNTNETVPSEANIQNAPAENQAGMPAENQGEGQNNGATENQGVAVDASQGEQGNSQQKFQNPQNRQFNKFNNKNNRRFDKNYRQNQRFQPEEEDTTPLPEPDSEAWNKARECWSKYRKMTMSDLQELAAQKENLDFRRYRKQSLGLLLQSLENENNIVYAEGLLEVTPQGHGFLRNTEFNYQQGPDDVYVSQNLIRKLGLKIGDTVAGLARRATRTTNTMRSAV